MLQLNLNRMVKIDHEMAVDGESASFSITFKFPYREDINVGELRDKVGGVVSTSEVTHYVFRKAIVEVEGFEDLSGNPLALEEPDLAEKQKAVYDVVRNDEAFLDKVLTAYTNLSPKNLKTGKTL